MDSLKSPAAAIVVGKLVPVGTGVFDILNDHDANPTDIGTVKFSKTPSSGKKRSSFVKAEEAGSGKRTKRFSFD
jgi:hypothetical protein